MRLYLLIGLTCLVLSISPGCNQGEKSNDQEPERTESNETDQNPIRIVFLQSSDDASATKMAERIKKELTALELGKAESVYLTIEELQKENTTGDLLVYPPHLFGDLVTNGLIREIPKYVTTSESFAVSDMLRHQRRYFGRYGDRRYGLSLGTSSLMLLCDVEKLAELGHQPPKTWKEYSDLCRKLKEQNAQKKITSSEKWSPAIEPLQGNWKAISLMARSGAYIRKSGRYSTVFSYTNWKPLIDQPPFARALDELKSVYQTMAPEHHDLSPAAVESAFIAGECLMAITWPHPQDRAEGASDEKPRGGLELLPLPGARDRYDFTSNSWDRTSETTRSIPMMSVDGLCISILKATQQPGVAARRLGLISGKEMISKLIPLHPKGFPSRAGQLSQLSEWISPKYSASFTEQFAATAQRQNESAVWMFRAPIEKAELYEQTLAAQIESALQGAESKAVLKIAAEKWNTINQSVDLARQKQINLKNLGVE